MGPHSRLEKCRGNSSCLSTGLGISDAHLRQGPASLPLAGIRRFRNLIATRGARRQIQPLASCPACAQPAALEAAGGEQPPHRVTSHG